MVLGGPDGENGGIELTDFHLNVFIGEQSKKDEHFPEVQAEKNGTDTSSPEVKVEVVGAGKMEKEKLRMVGYLEVFRFADWKDKLLMCLGTVFALANGAAMPINIVIFGNVIKLFVDTGKLSYFLTDIQGYLNISGLAIEAVFKDTDLLYDNCTGLELFYNGTKNITCSDIPVAGDIFDEMTNLAVFYCVLGCGVLFAAYAQVTFWMIAAERQAHRIRREFVRNVMKQDIGWFDTHNASELNTRLADDIAKIEDGIGDKMGTCIQWVATFITGYTIGFVNGWELTLVVMSISPVIAIAASLFNRLTASMTSKELEAYAKAGAVAEEVFSSIRTVVSFGGQEKEAERYYSNLGTAQKFGIRKGLTHGASLGFIWLAIFCSYALGFWYGGKLVREDSDYEVNTMIIVFFSVLVGSFSLGNAAPNIQTFATARAAAYVVFGVIDLKSSIDSSSEDGKAPSSLTGYIKFQNVHFVYPSRPGVKILNGIDLEVRPGQSVALVGSSGCGKSTIVQLLLRFYDPLQGKISLDGTSIKDLSIKWLRHHIGLVSQEPVLFATTIAENIRYGWEDVSMDEIVLAAKNANAYDFIMKLPDKFETLVGERGAQLSGGQKQRVAIARALVRDPKILLLDEATSALDTESESIVQDALDKARKGRTTIVIAHRLSTIKTADIIIGLDKGVVAERGTHDELMKQQGIYYQLVTNQPQDEIDEEIQEVVDTLQEKHKIKQAASVVQNQLSTTDDKSSDKDIEKLPNAPFSRLIKLNSPEWYLILLGCCGSIINGGIQPSFAIIFSRILGVLSESASEQEEKIKLYAVILVCLGLASFITMFLQGYMFGRSGECLTTRLRDISFRSMMKQDIAWYDDNRNSTGALITRLSMDASLVQGVTGSRLGNLFMSLSSIISALIIAFAYGWKLAFVILAFMPFIALGSMMRMRLIAGRSRKNTAALEGAGKVAVEIIENIRTVASLSKELTFFQLYMSSLKTPYEAALRNAHLVGFTFAFSQSVIYFAYASIFVFGAYLIEEKDMEYEDVFLVFGAIVFGAMGIGNAAAFAPDVGKAQTSAKKILFLLDSTPSIDYTCSDGNKLDANYEAEVTFQSAHFRYPTRPTVPVLQGLSFSVSPGETLALVGSSGCGKSTSVQLIERFYDTEDGAVCLASNDVKTLNIQWLRSQMSFVSQEPVLFDRSIAENIAYGDNSRVVSMDEIIEAARGANIHNFIASLPDGYNTNVGAKGTQLSGGQKQRVAIARALVRNPKILLLDEATSALDTESEKMVQESLDRARTGRTCVVIAHRLSTIQNANKICVISHGKVTETGTHSELMARQGFYYKLVKNSMRT